MFNLRGTLDPPKLMVDVSYDSRDCRWHKQVAELVLKFPSTVVETERDSQGTSFKCIFEVGSPLQIPQPITILPAETTSRALRHGSLKVTVIKTGQRRGLSFGFMVNVRVSPAFFLHALIAPGG